MKKLLLLTLILALIIPNTLAFYADLQINVDEAGKTSIQGVTNNKQILTHDNPEYTSKKGKYWVLNITKDELYNPYSFKVSLPKNSIVNYMKVSSFTRIENTASNLNIYGAGQGRITIILQYQIKSSHSNTLLPIIIILIILTIIAFVIIKTKTKSKINLNHFSERQQEILKIIIKNKGQITQKKLETLTKMPKSSLSRNIESLKRKEVIKKVQKGMSNLIILNKK